MTQLQAGRCDKMSEKQSWDRIPCDTIITQRGHKMVGDYSDQRGGPSKLHQLVLHKSEIAVFK